MSQTRGVRKPSPPTTSSPISTASKAQGSTPPVSSSTTPSSTVRSVQPVKTPSTVPPQSPAPKAQPPSPPPLAKKSEIQDARSGTEGYYSIRLKSDKDGITQAQRNAHMEKIQQLCQPYLNGSEKKYVGIQTKLTTIFPGYIGCFHPNVVKEIKSSKEVESVQEDQTVMTDAREVCKSWGVSRVTLSDEEFESVYTGTHDTVFKDTTRMGKLGKGVIVCIVDCDFRCNDFPKEDRIVYSDSLTLNSGKAEAAFAEGTSEGHGTVCTNIACGTEYGIAPEAQAWVYCPKGPLQQTQILIAFEKIAQIKTPGHIILSMSWSVSDPGVNNHLKYALDFLIKLHVIPVASAGNDGKYVDKTTKRFPQNVEGVIVVGNTDINNQLEEASNFGPNVDIYAPGTDIPAKDTTKPFTGTSMATPLVAGFLANLLSSEKDTGKLFSAADLCMLLQNTFSRTTGYYTDPTTKKQMPIRTITAAVPEGSMSKEIKPTLPAISKATSVLDISLTENGYTLLLPLDSKTRWTDQSGVEALLKAVRTKDYKGYNMIVKNGLASDVDTKMSWDALKQIRMEHDVTDDAKQQKRADGLLGPFASLMNLEQPVTRRVLSGILVS